MRRLIILLLGLILLAAFALTVYLAGPYIFGSVVVPLPDQYQPLIAKYADQYGIERCLISAIINGEGKWNERARSRAGASGLMQLMPGTAQAISRIEGLANDPKRIYDPDYNINRGVALVAYNFRAYGSLRNVLVAYNAGGGRVRLADSALPRETQRYLRTIPYYRDLYYTVYADFCRGGAVKTPTEFRPAPGPRLPAGRFEEFPGPLPEEEPNPLDPSRFWQNFLP